MRRLNMLQAKASQMLTEGDIISCSGKGRLQLEAVSTTKKGKYAVEIMRYV